MRKVINKTNQLLQKMKYNYTPVSNYEIQNKINPIIAVTVGDQKSTIDL